MTARIHITPTIANEYVSRDIFGECWCGGVVAVREERAREMLADAKHYADRDALDVWPSLRRSYRILADQIERALA